MIKWIEMREDCARCGGRSYEIAHSGPVVCLDCRAVWEFVAWESVPAAPPGDDPAPDAEYPSPPGGPAMTWTTELPTEPGWYWHCTQYGTMTILKVQWSTTDLVASFGATEFKLDRDHFPLPGEWYGPLAPPE